MEWENDTDRMEDDEKMVKKKSRNWILMRDCLKIRE